MRVNEFLKATHGDRGFSAVCDPPSRCVELFYNPTRLQSAPLSVISASSKHFGRWWHETAAGEGSGEGSGGGGGKKKGGGGGGIHANRTLASAHLYKWANAAQYWNVLPPYMEEIMAAAPPSARQQPPASSSSSSSSRPFGAGGTARAPPSSSSPSSSAGVTAPSVLFKGGGGGGGGGGSAALGPLLLDAAVERAKQRAPRIIAIGDVHGCVDELQLLLRRCDYQPGDCVVFLGDLVAKGPDSCGAVQMACELGALGVRGNHENEVVRWDKALKMGMRPPAIGGEHYNIAQALTAREMRWVQSCPWYIQSEATATLFVHAGFLAGLRMTRQNPRLMMNMRSILPDGTATAKHFSNWPWARLWEGPQTVVFGHDADRGLQLYDKAMGIDTGCVYGGRLTAYLLPEKKLVSVSAKREYYGFRPRSR